MKRDRRSEKVYLPTAQEIQLACERIQRGWSERERRKRSGQPEGNRWSPPLVHGDLNYGDGFGHTSDTPVG